MIGLTKFANSFPCQLSGGNSVSVARARTFANDPELLLMDEPFGALMNKTASSCSKNYCASGKKIAKQRFSLRTALMKALVLSDRVMVATAQPGRIKQ